MSYSEAVSELIKSALHEDCPTADITSDLMLPIPRDAIANVVAKQTGIFCGTIIVEAICCHFPTLKWDHYVSDGDTINPDTPIFKLSGDLKVLLKLERVMLNFLQRLSGISTMTRQFIDALNDQSIDILDTRKTTPLLRDLEKYAVAIGGGKNHRHGLSDMVLIKENHFNHLSTANFNTFFPTAICNFKHHHPEISICIEIETLSQLESLKLQHVDIILLDNFSIPDINTGVSLAKKKYPNVEFEVSGNVSLSTIHRYRGLPIDRISIGSLTHSVPAFDFSMLVEDVND